MLLVANPDLHQCGLLDFPGKRVLPGPADPRPADRQSGAEWPRPVSPRAARELLERLDGYTPLRCRPLRCPASAWLSCSWASRCNCRNTASNWNTGAGASFCATHLIDLPQPGKIPGRLLLVASSELPGAFYTGTVTASAGGSWLQPGCSGR